MFVHITPSILHPGEWFVFWQSKQGAQKEKQATTKGKDKK
jgi:hypothetical protein